MSIISVRSNVREVKSRLAGIVESMKPGETVDVDNLPRDIADKLALLYFRKYIIRGPAIDTAHSTPNTERYCLAIYGGGVNA